MECTSLVDVMCVTKQKKAVTDTYLFRRVVARAAPVPKGPLRAARPGQTHEYNDKAGARRSGRDEILESGAARNRQSRTFGSHQVAALKITQRASDCLACATDELRDFFVRQTNRDLSAKLRLLGSSGPLQ